MQVCGIVLVPVAGSTGGIFLVPDYSPNLYMVEILGDVMILLN
jgi:hypothetical protein